MQQNGSHNSSYDYIITGAGCAGLSLLLRMQQSSFFKEKKILLIEANEKKQNDRTWCFWEKEAGLFQDIVYKQWRQIDFYSQSFSARFEIAPYFYKMIRGADLYKHVFDQLAVWQNVVFIEETVQRTYSESNRAYVQTAAGIYNAQYVFNSILFEPQLLQTKGSLLQHFKGWMITSEDKVFNNEVATFMDFRLRPQKENTFVYVLPVSDYTALVEYTVFSPSLLEKEEYTNGLQQYISQYLGVTNYVITEEEFGVIPMSTFTFTQNASAVINIGTAGGQTKSSSGYTFQFIQKHSAAIASALMKNEHPGKQSSFFDKRFNMYDNTLLHVLFTKKLTAAEIFSDLFRQNKPQLIFKFLDNETTIQEDLKIMMSVPFQVFLPAAWKQFFRL